MKTSPKAWYRPVSVSSPEVEKGFMYSVQFNAGEGAPGSTGKNTSVGAFYTSGPLQASGTWQRVRNGPGPWPAGFDHQSTFQFGASYELSFIRLYGQVGRVKTNADTDVRSMLYQVGAASPNNYRILIGFQMTPAELAYQRARMNPLTGQGPAAP